MENGFAGLKENMTSDQTGESVGWQIRSTLMAVMAIVLRRLLGSEQGFSRQHRCNGFMHIEPQAAQYGRVSMQRAAGLRLRLNSTSTHLANALVPAKVVFGCPLARLGPVPTGKGSSVPGPRRGLGGRAWGRAAPVGQCAIARNLSLGERDLVLLDRGRVLRSRRDDRVARSVRVLRERERVVRVLAQVRRVRV